MDLADDIKNKIIETSEKYSGILRILLFGSRARGCNEPNSDIDLAVYMNDGDLRGQYVLFCEELEEIDTLLKFDLVIVDENLDKMIADNIEREGICIVDKFLTKLDYYKKAVDRVKESIAEHETTGSLSVRDGAIQRFEFTVELAWKTMREFLTAQGFSNLNSPKEVLKQAYAYGLIDNDLLWLNIINDRNATSHLYKEAAASEIFCRIKDQYIDTFAGLADKLSREG